MIRVVATVLKYGVQASLKPAIANQCGILFSSNMHAWGYGDQLRNLEPSLQLLGRPSEAE